MHFDANRKIQTIRLYWDQGSLLKQVDVIGARARNWPLRDGKDQARLIRTADAITSQSPDSNHSVARTGGQNAGEADITSRPASSKSGTGDPHASMSLFTQVPQQEPSHYPAVVPPRASAKPPPRDLRELFASNESDGSQAPQGVESSPSKDHRHKAQSANPPPRDYHELFVGEEGSPAPPQAKSSSPQKGHKSTSSGTIAPKGGSGKNFQPSRLFTNENAPSGASGLSDESPGKFVKLDPKKFNHFDLGEIQEGTRPQLPHAAGLKSKHVSQWGFEDFMTPEKFPQKIRSQNARHFGWDNDEDIVESPVQPAKVGQPRPDAKTHFEFQDDGTPAGGRRPPGHPRGQGVQKVMGLYRDNVIEGPDRSTSPGKKSHPLATMVNLKDQRKNFDPHFTLADDSPADKPSNGTKAALDQRQMALQTLDAPWEANSGGLHGHTRGMLGSPGKENQTGADRGIKTGGDGMGGTKGVGRSWGFGDESDEEGQGEANGGKFRAGKKQQRPQDNRLWDF